MSSPKYPFTEYIHVSPDVLSFKTDHTTELLRITNTTHTELIVWTVESHNLLQISPYDSYYVFPGETTKVSCKLIKTASTAAGERHALEIKAVSISSERDLSSLDVAVCKKLAEGYIQAGSPYQIIRCPLNIESEDEDDTSATGTQTKTDDSQPNHVDTTTASSTEEISSADQSNTKSTLAAESHRVPQWITYAEEMKIQCKQQLDSLIIKIEHKDNVLNDLISQYQTLSIGSEAVLHMLSIVRTEVGTLSSVLSSKSIDNLNRLKHYYENEMAVLHQNLTAMVQQHTKMLGIIDEHASILAAPWIAVESAAVSSSTATVTSSAVTSSSSESLSSARKTSSLQDYESTAKHTTESESTAEVRAHTKTTNAIDRQEEDNSLRNINTNAVEPHNASHRVRDYKYQLDELARTQQLIDTDVHQAYKAVKGLSSQTDDLLNMLTILTNDVRVQREKTTSNIGGVEELMKKFGFKLSDLEAEGDRSKALITMLESNLSTHINKLNMLTNTVASEQVDIKKGIKQLNKKYKAAKCDILALSDGMVEEHEHITLTNDEFHVRMESIHNKQQMANRILKDMHKDLRIAVCKLKHIVCQLNRLIMLYNEFRRVLYNQFNSNSDDPNALMNMNKSAEEMKLQQLRTTINDLEAYLKDIEAKNEFVVAKIPEQTSAMEEHLTFTEEQLEKVEKYVEEQLASRREEVAELIKYLQEKIDEFYDTHDDLTDRLDSFHKEVDKFKDELTGSGSGMNKALIDMMAELKKAAAERMAKVNDLITKMNESVDHLNEDLTFLNDITGGFELRLANVATDLEINWGDTLRQIEAFIRDRQVELSSYDVRSQNAHKMIMEELKLLIEMLSGMKTQYRDIGININKFSVKMKNLLEDIDGSINNTGVQMRIHEHSLRNKMHELLRQYAGDNHRALVELRKIMTGEINARIDQVSKEQFKEVQIYLDRIKERINKTTRGLQTAQTSADWLFYFLMVLCVLITIFLLTAISYDAEEVPPHPVASKPWLSRAVSQTLRFVWHWDE